MGGNLGCILTTTSHVRFDMSALHLKTGVGLNIFIGTMEKKWKLGGLIIGVILGMLEFLLPNMILIMPHFF